MIDVFIGYDVRDDRAFRVCEASLRSKSSIPLRVWPIREWEMRKRLGYARQYTVAGNGQMTDLGDGKPFSTQFSFTRFLVPALADYRDGLAVFCDADMLWRADIAELLSLCTDGKAAYCVWHAHEPALGLKMDGVQQTQYRRKNWSSLVVWNPAKNRFLTPEQVNSRTGAYLHAFGWLADDEIGSLPEAWNWLENWSPPMDPKIVHFTDGTPDMLTDRVPAFTPEWVEVWKRTQRCSSELERTWF